MPTREAIADALRIVHAAMPPGCRWEVPGGGMFFWVELPEGVDATALLAQAVALGVAYVPGAAFFADRPRHNTLRLSFVSVAPPAIARGVELLAQALNNHLETLR